MISRHYFIAAKIKGSDVHTSGVITVKSYFSQPADVVFERAKKSLAAACDLQVDDFVSVAFNRI